MSTTTGPERTAPPAGAGGTGRAGRQGGRLAWLRPGAPAPPRLRRRRRLVLASVLPALVLLVLAARLLLLPVHLGQAQEAHTGDDGAGVVDAGEKLSVLNVVERWRAPFVEGTGRSMSGDLAGGRADLETALSRTGTPQDDCTVRTNLVLTVSAQADAAGEGGDADGEKRLAEEALTLIEEGPEGCLDGSDDGSGGAAGQAQREEQEKLEEQAGRSEEGEDGQGEDEGQDEGQDDPQEGEPQQGEEPQDPQEEELEERNEEGRSTAEQERRRDQSGVGGPDPVEKPW